MDMVRQRWTAGKFWDGETWMTSFTWKKLAEMVVELLQKLPSISTPDVTIEITYTNHPTSPSSKLVSFLTAINSTTGGSYQARFATRGLSIEAAVDGPIFVARQPSLNCSGRYFKDLHFLGCQFLEHFPAPISRKWMKIGYEAAGSVLFPGNFFFDTDGPGGRCVMPIRDFFCKGLWWHQYSARDQDLQKSTYRFGSWRF